MEQKFRQLVRVASADLDGNKSIVRALRKLKGVSFMFSNAVCNNLGIDRNQKAGGLSEEQVKSIEGLLLKPEGIPRWMLNRRRDYDSGDDKHLLGPQVQFVRGFDIKRMQETKSNRGLRHAWGLPVRGQRTKSHFRKGRSVGVMKKAAKAAAAAKPAAPAAKKEGKK